MRSLALLFLLSFIPTTSSAQFNPGRFVLLGEIQNSDGSTVLGGGASLPPTCTDRSTWVLTSAPSGQQLYICESGVWVLSSGSSTILSRIISDAIDASGEVRIGGPSDYYSIYYDSVTDSPTIDATCNDTDCDSTGIGVPTSGDAHFYQDGTLAKLWTIDNTGLITHEHQRMILFGPGSWFVDGGVCLTPQEITIALPSGSEKKLYTKCTTKSASGQIDLSTKLDGSVKTGTDLTVRIVSRNTDSEPSDSADFTVAAKCEDTQGGDAIDFGSTQDLLLSFDTQYRWQEAVATVTPGGECKPHSIASVQLNVKTGVGENETQLASVLHYEISVSYTAERQTSE